MACAAGRADDCLDSAKSLLRTFATVWIDAEANGSVQNGAGRAFNCCERLLLNRACDVLSELWLEHLHLPDTYISISWKSVMPLFHFNSRTGGVVLEDPVGEELPNVAAAREVAFASARETLIEAVKTRDTVPDCIHVIDGDGQEVATVFLADLLRK
jgi:hypothetical protein